MAHHVKNVYPFYNKSCIHFIMLAHHQLAEHDEPVRLCVGAIDSLRARAVECTRFRGGYFGHFD